MGMNKDAVQHERGPRNSTLRRQMSLYFKEHPQTSPTASSHHRTSTSPSSTILPQVPSTGSPIVSTPSSLMTGFAGGISPPPSNHPSIPGLADLSLSKSYQFHLSLINDARNAAIAAAAAASVAASSNGSPMYGRPQHPASPVGLLHAPIPKYPHELNPPSPPAFNLMSPFLQQFNSRENISESAARLLFMNVRWAQHVPAFSTLPYRDQLLLLEESWRELFVLSASQFNLPIELATMVENPTASVELLSNLKNFQETIHKFQQMGIDATEYACLRAIVLLKASVNSNGDNSREIRDQSAVASLQDQAQLTLSKYIEKAYPTQPSRFGKLLLLLPALKSVSSLSIEELFFKKTIGVIPIERIICDMYKAGSV